jgi:hypothetical protein
MAPKKVTNVEKPKRKIIMTTVELKKNLSLSWPFSTVFMEYVSPSKHYYLSTPLFIFILVGYCMYDFMHIILVLLYHVYIKNFINKMLYNQILEILNGLIQFTLFLMGKFNSKVEQTESRTASWNRLCSTVEGPLYIYIYKWY